jgi:hypothetical protein
MHCTAPVCSKNNLWLVPHSARSFLTGFILTNYKVEGLEVPLALQSSKALGVNYMYFKDSPKTEPVGAVAGAVAAVWSISSVSLYNCIIEALYRAVC